MASTTQLYEFLDESDPAISQDLIPVKFAPIAGKKLVSLYRDFLAKQEDLIEELIKEVLANPKITEKQKAEFKAYYDL